MSKQILLSGIQLSVCIRAITWVEGCPFSKTQKPAIPSEKELLAINNRLLSIVGSLRSETGFDDALEDYEGSISIEFSEAELIAISQCIEAVLKECDGDPVELEIRVGSFTNVTATQSHLRMFI